MSSTPKPPSPPINPHALSQHGQTRIDPYYWMRDENWQEVMRDPSVLRADIRAHLEAENAYTDELLADTAGLQERLYQEMRARIKEDDSSVPQPDGPHAYFVQYEEGAQYPAFCRQPRAGGAAETLLDVSAEAEGKKFFQIGGVAHSHDHAYLAYGVDETGSEYYEIRLRRIGDSADLAEGVPDTTGTVVWAPDTSGFFYTRLDENHRPTSIYWHALGSAPEDDALVFHEENPAYVVGITLSESRRYFQIHVSASETSEIHLIPADAPLSPPRCLMPRRQGHEYEASDIGETLFILTNRDGAEDFKLMAVPLGALEAEWREVLPHRPGCLRLHLTAFSRHLVLLERQNALPRIVIHEVTGEGELGPAHSIGFDEEAYSLGLEGGFEFDTTTLRFTYASPTTPRQVFDYDMGTRERVLRKTQEVPSGHDPKDYVARRLMIPSHDGAEVPVTVLHHAKTKLDGSAPLLLYGYGSYGAAMPASFSLTRLSLVDRGFVYAIAHIRGGKERGYRWYRDGKLDRKKNSFEDFIAAGRGLAQAGFTREGRIIAHGGSAGGLLVGAAANMAPDLFLGIIAEVPFVDVLTTICDASLPLTPPEWTEWGNPIEDAKTFDYIASYSPYDNIQETAYPHILATAGLTDPRVTYWEPAKWVARLRALRTDDGLTLLKTYMGAGHAGASGRFEQLREVAFTTAFALMIAGKDSA